MENILGVVSGILITACFIPYIRDIIKGKTKPERASWLIWMVVDGVAFFTQLAKGATDSLWLTGINTIGIAIVFLLSLKVGIGGLMKRDIFSLILAGIGLLLWYSFQEAAIALFIVIGIDVIGGILTVQKAYEKPSTETLSTWVIASVAGIVAMASVGKPDGVLLSFPFSVFLLNTSVTIAILLGRKKVAMSYLKTV